MNKKIDKDVQASKTRPTTIPNSEDCLDYVQPDGVNEDGSTNVKTERDGLTSKPNSVSGKPSTEKDEKKPLKSQES